MNSTSSPKSYYSYAFMAIFAVASFCLVFFGLRIAQTRSLSELFGGSDVVGLEEERGFLDARPIVVPNSGLEKDEKAILRALKKVTIALSRGASIEEILNECDPYSEVFFGRADRYSEYSELSRFVALDYERNCAEDGSAADEILLVDALGAIRFSRSPDAYKIEIYMYEEDLALALGFSAEGTLRELCWYEYSYGKRNIAESRRRLPEIKRIRPVRHRVVWEEDGKFVKEKIDEEIAK